MNTKKSLILGCLCWLGACGPDDEAQTAAAHAAGGPDGGVARMDGALVPINAKLPHNYTCVVSLTFEGGLKGTAKIGEVIAPQATVFFHAPTELPIVALVAQGVLIHEIARAQIGRTTTAIDFAPVQVAEHGLLVFTAGAPSCVEATVVMKVE